MTRRLFTAHERGALADHAGVLDRFSDCLTWLASLEICVEVFCFFCRIWCYCI